MGPQYGNRCSGFSRFRYVVTYWIFPVLDVPINANAKIQSELGGEGLIAGVTTFGEGT